MKQRWCIIVLIFLSSCSHDYDVGGLAPDVSPKVVVTCVITPEEPIFGYLTWSSSDNGSDFFLPVDNAFVKIYENDRLIISSQTQYGLIISDYYPEAGEKYTLSVSVPDYGEVTGETYIPKPPHGNAVFIETRHNEISGDYYHHFRISDIQASDQCRAIWVYGKYRYQEESAYSYPASYFPTTTKLDQENLFVNSSDLEHKGSNISCTGFMRMPRRFLPQTEPFNVSFQAAPTFKDEEKEFIISDLSFDFICPSDEYDLYFRSVYKQYKFSYDAGGSIPVFNPDIYIQSNIDNGLGIFAGYSAFTVSYSDFPDYFEENLGPYN